MKIINRLYFKVILISALLITISTMLYYTKDYYQKKSKEQLEKHSKVLNQIKKDAQTKIQILEDKIQKYKKDAQHLKQPIIIKKVLNQDCQKSLKIKTKVVVKERYKKTIMYNIHHQILQELDYAPYLPVSQLQEMMDKKFVLDDMSFSITISNKNIKLFEGIIFDKNKTISIIRDGEVLEVRFDTK